MALPHWLLVMRRSRDNNNYDENMFGRSLVVGLQLRALSGSGGHEGGSPPPPALGTNKYKLADYRYGREEMLALISHSPQPPANLDTEDAFFSSKPREPLSVEPITEEEATLLRYGVNSDAVRAAARTGAALVGENTGGNGEILDVRGVSERGNRGIGRGGRGGARGRGSSTTGLRGNLRGTSTEEELEPGKRGTGAWGDWSDSRYGGGGATAGASRGSSTAVDNWRQREGLNDEAASGGDWRHTGNHSKWGERGPSWRERGFDEERRGGHTGRGGWRGSGNRPAARRERGFDDDDDGYEIDDGEDRDGPRDASSDTPRNSTDPRESSHSPPSRPRKDSELVDDHPNEAGDSRRIVDPSGVDEPTRKQQDGENRPNVRMETNDSTKRSESSADADASGRHEMSVRFGTDFQLEVADQSNTRDEVSKATASSHTNPVHIPVDQNAHGGNGDHVDALLSQRFPPGRDNISTTHFHDASGEPEVSSILNSNAGQGMKSTSGLSPESSSSPTIPVSWFYRDPSGVIQGPFTPSEMSDWFLRGFFKDALLLRRSFDEHFMSLGQMKARFGSNPFSQQLAQPTPPKDLAVTDPAIVSQAFPQASRLPQTMLPPLAGNPPTSSQGLMSGLFGNSSSQMSGLPSSPLRAPGQPAPQTRGSPGDILSAGHARGMQNMSSASIGSAARRLNTDAQGTLSLPQYLANMPLSKDAGNSWKTGPLGGSMPGIMDDRGVMQQDVGQPGLNFMQNLQQSSHQQMSHPQNVHMGLGPQIVQKSSTPVQQLLTNMLGPNANQMQPHSVGVPGLQHDQANQQTDNSLSALLQKLNMQNPQGNVQQIPYMEIDQKDPLKNVGAGHFSLPMMQPRAPLPGVIHGSLPNSHGMPINMPIPSQNQQPHSDAFQSLLLQMKHQQGLSQTLMHQLVLERSANVIVDAKSESSHCRLIFRNSGDMTDLCRTEEDVTGWEGYADNRSSESESRKSEDSSSDDFPGTSLPSRSVSVGVQTSNQLLLEYFQKFADFLAANRATYKLLSRTQSQGPDEASLAEERKMREEIEEKKKAVDEERKRLEQERLQWEEDCRRKREQQLEEDRKRKEEEERLKLVRQEEAERLEAERRQMAFLQQQRLELQKELEKKEAERKRQEEEERMQALLEKKRQEEIQRRAYEVEALKRKLEHEEKERQLHEAARAKAQAATEASERLRLSEIQRREAEEEQERERVQDDALQTAILKNAVGGVPWGGKGPQVSSSTSFLEVQAQEEMELSQRAPSPPQKVAQNEWSAAGVPLRWATQAQVQAPVEPKSLAEIQAEEEQKMKMITREKQRAAASAAAARAQKENAALAPTSQGISWASKAACGLPAATPSPPLATPVAPKPVTHAAAPTSTWSNATSPHAAKAAAPAPAPASVPTGSFWSTVAKGTQKQQQVAPQAKANPPGSKPKNQPAKKNDDHMMKLFDHPRSKSDDDFTKWCYKALEELQIGTTIDVATFIAFLKDVESPFEVQDYGASYLGTDKPAKEFIREFLERRSKWKNSMKSAKAPEDSMLGPAKAINPNSQSSQSSQVHHHSNTGNHSSMSSQTLSADAFHVVKGKGKSKKNKKMQKVDNSILGFSVTAASDRVNVGDREFVDGM
ncbi:unnamed protein product [Notodromas monacha]|uniref:GYF domain-containing protein n=1 Tax=Notodromas monacha TaxID=399045 RepID=A0A7R9BHP1_9CRUS|nr:unnamed protein product [Notodromas monacha]CAG0914312.1 unnamed protein product [Notodromas monacha]